MSELPILPPDSQESDVAWEGRVRQTASHLRYPPTPDLVRGMRAGMRQQAAQRLRLVRAVAAVLLILAGLMAVPQVRAEVRRILQIGVVRIFFGGETPTPTITTLPAMPLTATPQGAPSRHPTLTPIPTATPLGSVLGLPGETTLADAQDRTSFTITMPTYPANLGDPDHVFYFNVGDSIVVLVWTDPDQPDKVRLSLFEFGPNADVWKKGLTSGQELEIDGQTAFWSDQPHYTEFYTNTTVISRWVDTTVLVWFEPPITYRLEGAESLEEALRIVKSLR